MSTGQVLSFSVGFSFDNGNKGFDLYSNTDGTGQAFNFNIGNSYSWTGSGSANMTTWTGVRENGVVINFSFTKTASGFSYTINSSQDAGLTQSGNITAAGLGSLKFYISGAGGGDGGNLYFNNLQITSSPTAPSIAGGSYAVASVGAAFSYQISASPAATSYNATGLPAGLTLNSTTGLISGSPSGSGSSIVSLTATNEAGTSAPFSLTIAVGLGADSAQNYNGAWTTGSNQGVGFGNWTLTSNSGTNGFAGSFIGNPSSSGISGMPSSSFALYANPNTSGAFSNAERALSTPLANGQSLSFQWGINWDSGVDGNKGFVLSTVDGESIVVSNTSTSNITVETKTGNSTTDTGVGFGTTAMLWSFTQTTNTSVSITATPRGSGNTYTTSLPTTGPITSVKFYAFQMQAGDNAQPYFNNFLIQGGSTPQPTAYESWATFYGLNATATTGPSAGAPAADPDSDTFTNQQEYAFGTNPTQANAGLVTTSTTGGNLTVIFLVRSGLDYNVQSTDNLSTTAFANNSAVTGTVTDSSSQDGVPSGYTRRQFTITPSGSKNFYRVIASEQTPG
ncbi:MAG: putative Ig domain-containing protein [Planctomycetia bacterium]